jgi:sugar/nucleoside kinase (ribokinase family)
MVDVALYGNLTKDIIFNGFEQTTSIGSIGNVWDALVKLNQKLTIHIEPTTIGTALIYVDTDNNTRVSKPNLYLKVNQPKVVEAKWSHILYLNHIKDLEFLKSIQNSIISADVAGKGKFHLDILTYIDYLFISDEDIIDLDILLGKIKGCVILHSNSGSTIYKKDGTTIVTNHKTIDGVNVLGAGDYFASAFINFMLQTNDIEVSIKIAHNETISFLKDKI